jgi:hypothetical protein
MTDLEKNQVEAMRAWEEFGRPLAGSTVGSPPKTSAAKTDNLDLSYQQDNEAGNETHRSRVA